MTVNKSFKYPKRLIEVDLPIKKISEHARREKSIRHGHISTLHLWWARRPLAACRAVICAALWPDPADPLCPNRFRTEAEEVMRQFWNPIGVTDRDFSDPFMLQQALFDFIADFSNWDHSTDERYLSTARKLTQVAHESLGGEPGTRPLIVDPFAGGGAIPLEALRVGADTFASDLNPVAVLLNKAVLEYIPKYGNELANEVRRWGQWVKEEAEKELAEFYPKDPDGATPIAYLWARTIQCEGPGCGAEVPLIKNLWLGKKPHNSWCIEIIPDNLTKKIDLTIRQGENVNIKKPGTISRGGATCPICGFTTPKLSIRKQLKDKKGGTNSSRLFTVVTVKSREHGRIYRPPLEKDLTVCKNAQIKLKNLEKNWKGSFSLIPNEPYPDESGAGALSSSVLYGFKTWADIFTERQKLTLGILYSKISLINEDTLGKTNELLLAVRTILAFNVDKMADYGSSLASWSSPASQETVRNTFSRQALPMIWDYAEAYPFVDSSGGWTHNLDFVISPIVAESNTFEYPGTVSLSSALTSSLPNDSASAFITDPPYYDAIAYGDLSDFFYVWLKRTLFKSYPSLFKDDLVQKDEEIVQLSKRFKGKYPHKTKEFYESGMKGALAEGRRILAPNKIGVIVFAHKSTAGWEAQIQALIESGWIVTGSWPIDTERPGRTNAIETASLASSIHLVCRPRENPDGSLREEIGDWRDILAELPGRIHEWMPRLAKEGVVGADAIFACLGPALEIFSRYSRVEKASGDEVPLREYLEHVWAAVSREALGMIFEGADATGFEEDARITAMWLWTLKTAESPALNGKNGKGIKEQPEESEEDDGEEAEGSGKKKVKGFSLEYDAARKIAQGLGAHLEEMHTLVEIKKGNARLLPVSERAAYLLKSEKEKPIRRPKKKEKQSTLFPLEMEGSETPEEDFGDVAEIGKTTLDKVHQSMLLFAAGQSDALKRFLVDEGIGKNAQFWTLAQALAALYPTGTEEKRWVEGVLARKKGLGL